MRTLLVSFVLFTACKREAPPPREATSSPPAPAAADARRAEDPDLERDREAYVADVMAFTNTTHEQVRERMRRGAVPLKQEWEAWEREGPMTDERTAAFYKQTTNYIYELAEWHLWVDGKRASDLQLVADMKQLAPKNILDFGGGVGLNAIMLAQAGFNVTLADLDSTSLAFAQFRAKRHGVKLKIWKTDVEPMPPDATYDVILALDVLEHLPKEVLEDSVNKLVKLKHAQTKVIMSAPFGRTSIHPMHLDATEHTKAQVRRLKKDLPAG